MKHRALMSLILAGFLALCCGRPLFAQGTEGPDELLYKKSGFFLGGELGALIGFGDGDVFGAPGKLDLLAGYQVNPYISVGADLWTFWFIAYAAEAHVKANFTDTKISPYAVGTVGVVRLLDVWGESETRGTALTYSAGLGVDFHLWRHGTLFAEARYRGGRSLDWGASGHGLETGVGCRWMF